MSVNVPSADSAPQSLGPASGKRIPDISRQSVVKREEKWLLGTWKVTYGVFYNAGGGPDHHPHFSHGKTKVQRSRRLLSTDTQVDSG